MGPRAKNTTSSTIFSLGVRCGQVGASQRPLTPRLDRGWGDASPHPPLCPTDPRSRSKVCKPFSSR